MWTPPLCLAVLLAISSPTTAPAPSFEVMTQPATQPATRPEDLPAPEVDEATGVTLYRDVPYVTGDEANPVKHRLDLYLPAEDAWREGEPLVIWFHGGGWTMGDKDAVFGLYSRYCRTLAEHGVATANVSYRLTPSVRHPGHVQDAAAATAWLIRHAGDFGYNPSAVFVSGHSAGGHLAALLAADPRWLESHGLPPGSIAGAIVSSGVFNVAPLTEMGGRWQRVFERDQAAEASPVNHVDAADPPFIFLIEENGLFMRRQTQAMVDALQAVGAAPQVVGLPGVNHITMLQDLLFGQGWHVTTTMRFIDEVLTDRQESPPADGPAKRADDATAP